MTTKKLQEMGIVMNIMMKLEAQKIKSTRVSIAFLAIAGMPGINSENLAKVCKVGKRLGWECGNTLVKAGLAEIKDIEKTETVRGRRVAGFHLTPKGESLIK